MKMKLLGIVFMIILYTVGCSNSPVTKQHIAMPQTEIQIKPQASLGNNAAPDNNADNDEKNNVGSNETISSEAIVKDEIDKLNEANEKSIKGKVICIDPGHGNPDHEIKYEPIMPSSNILKPATAYGTTGISTKIPEYKLTMAISLKIRDQLIKKGAKVLMTRESNEVDLSNIERAEIANKASADIAVRIHADGSENLSVTGISVLYPGNQNINDEVLVRKSKEAAKLTLEKLVKSTGGKSRGIVERNDLTGFNWSRVPVILIEMGFMTNPEEDQALNTEEYQNKITEGIINGLISYFCE